MTFHVGQKVVRLDVKSSYDAIYADDTGWPSHIGVGGVFTVRDVDTRAAAFGWPIVLRLEEHFEAPGDLADLGLGLWESGFAGDCFRPAVSRPTSISFAHEILRRSSKQVDA